MRIFSDLFCFDKDSWWWWFTQSAFILCLRSTIEVRIFSLGWFDVRMKFSSWEWWNHRLCSCRFLSSNPSFFIDSISFSQGFRWRDIIVGEKFLLFINPLKIFLGSYIKSIPLLDDFGDNLGFSEFRELCFVLVVLLSRKLTVDSSKSFIFAFLTHEK